MGKLSPEQLRFLESQSIPLSRVFDATGMSRPAYQSAMGVLEAVVAFGASPCKARSHTLRTRGGHCAQCNTHALAFVLRHDDPGQVYVAASKQSGLVKVGTSNDAQSRMNNLISYGYGGANDWRVFSHYACEKAGRVEFAAHKALAAHRTSRTYVKTGSSVNCQELFTCSAETAAEAVQLAITQLN